MLHHKKRFCWWIIWFNEKHDIPIKNAGDMINSVMKFLANLVKSTLKTRLGKNLSQALINQIERKVIFMYSKGFSTRDISNTIFKI